MTEKQKLVADLRMLSSLLGAACQLHNEIAQQINEHLNLSEQKMLVKLINNTSSNIKTNCKRIADVVKKMEGDFQPEYYQCVEFYPQKNSPTNQKELMLIHAMPNGLFTLRSHKINDTVEAFITHNVIEKFEPANHPEEFPFAPYAEGTYFCHNLALATKENDGSVSVSLFNTPDGSWNYKTNYKKESLLPPDKDEQND